MSDSMSGKFWQAKSEEFEVYCISAPTQADVFLDIVSFLMTHEDSRVVACSFGATIEREGLMNYSADVVISKAMR